MKSAAIGRAGGHFGSISLSSQFARHSLLPFVPRPFERCSDGQDRISAAADRRSGRLSWRFRDYSSFGRTGRSSGRVLETLFQRTAFGRPARLAPVEPVGEDTDVPANFQRFVAGVQATVEFATTGSVELGGRGQTLAPTCRATRANFPQGLANASTPRSG